MLRTRSPGSWQPSTISLFAPPGAFAPCAVSTPRDYWYCHPQQPLLNAAPHRHADSERDDPGGHRARSVPRRLIRDAISHSRVVLRHINHLRVRRLDHNDLLSSLVLGRYSLLLRGLQVAGSLGLLAQPLDRRHHIGLLVMNSVARADVHGRFFAIWSSTVGNTQSAFTLGSGVPGLLIDSLYPCVVFRATAVDEIVRRRDLIGIRTAPRICATS